MRRKNYHKSFEKTVNWISLLLILGLIGYCIYNKLSFSNVLILVFFLIILPYASNITEFTFFNLLKVKIEKEVKRLLYNYVKAYKQLQQRETISRLSDNSIKLKFLPDPTTIKLTFGHETIIPQKDQENFEVKRKEIKIKNKATIRKIEYFINQPPAYRPIVEYLRKVNNST